MSLDTALPLSYLQTNMQALQMLLPLVSQLPPLCHPNTFQMLQVLCSNLTPPGQRLPSPVLAAPDPRMIRPLLCRA